MPTNIEIKAKLRDRSAAEAAADRLRTAGPEVIRQEDHFFKSSSGRLKLRIFGPESGELIRYERANTPGPRRSHYIIVRTADPYTLLEILTAELGQIGTVSKMRTLYLIGQTRVHLDRVEGLGEFLELEVVLRPEQSEAEGQNIAERLLQEFKIDARDLVSEAYIDLLVGRTGSAVEPEV
ncbi:MAG: class IV adenylate cyclase [Acidobacteriaceae bacterium]|nr:class IV adenylate cyclase [Acidobacteriaceae bacterium]